MIDRSAKSRYEIFVQIMFKAYSQRLRRNNVPWLSSDMIEKHMRRVWTMCGRELVSSVTWGKKCACQDSKCEHSIAAVEKGVEYVRSAQNRIINFDEDTFLKPLYQTV